ncbi:AraC family transcriptional regulator [Myroides marinus]|uniref:AraC family transcriptional regulator n=1 Tax=Myroides marinus TaxID=703342 RepID=UPI0025764884|nr:helix-turn-helix domain-containing protein [Myroides marinus]MDM1406006.1 AraC family transcriptional regulator [Myroides marinus]
MQVEYFSPRVELKSIISRFWAGKVHCATTVDNASYRILASGSTGIVVQLFQNHSKLFNSTDHRKLPLAFIYGQKTDAPCLNHFSTDTTVLGVDFHPMAFKRIFGVNTTELTNTIASLEDLLPESICRRLFQSENLQEAIVVLEQYFLTKLGLAPDTAKLEYALRQIQKAPFLLNTDLLAGEIGMSRRSFQRHFKEQIGVDASTYSRIIRFQKALHSLKCVSNVSLTQLAYDLGYADQSHLGREFKLFVGESPKQFVKQSSYLDTPTIDIHIPFRIIGVE